MKNIIIIINNMFLFYMKRRKDHANPNNLLQMASTIWQVISTFS